MPSEADRSARPSERVAQALATDEWDDVLGGLGAIRWYRFEHRPGRGAHRTLTLLVGDREIQVGVSPGGRSVRVFVDGKEA